MFNLGKKNSSEKAREFSQAKTRSLSRESIALVGLLLLLICFGLLRLPWPGDSTFTFDEPQLLEIALQANATGESLPYGLKGLRGVHYGPFPIWIYRFALSLTHNLISIIVLRVLIVTIITSLSIIWIALTCRRLWPLAGAAVLLSPHLWFYSRSLGDNSFCIPLTALAFAAYLAFCHRKQFWTLALTALCLTFLFLTHLISLPVIAVITLHFFIFHRAWWRKYWWAPLLCLAVGTLIAWPYIAYLKQASISPPSYRPVTYDSFSAQAWVFALLGGRFFTAYGMDYFLGTSWLQQPHLPGLLKLTVGALGRFTGIALLACWMGMVCCSVTTVYKLRHKQEQDIRFHGCLISLAIVLCQMALNGLTKTSGFPHYYNATWVYSFFFFWIAISHITSRKWRNLIFGGYSLAMVSVLVFIMVNIHATGGNRERYGPTLANQIAVARELNRYDANSPVKIQIKSLEERYGIIRHSEPVAIENAKSDAPKSSEKTQIKNVNQVPPAIKFLQRLYVDSANRVRPKRNLAIRYVDENRHSGLIEVVELQ